MGIRRPFDIVSPVGVGGPNTIREMPDEKGGVGNSTKSLFILTSLKKKWSKFSTHLRNAQISLKKPAILETSL